MISSIKGMESTLIQSESHRKFLENFESDLLRGVGKLCILKVIKNHGDEGIYGYQLLKELKELTDNMLIIKEGTLYPLLRNLESWGSKEYYVELIRSEKRYEGDERPRKYYFLTKEGDKIVNHMEGFFSKLTEAISKLIDFNIIFNEEKYSFCPNCANKIDVKDKISKFCEVCGQNLQQLKKGEK
jgi:PadR family transcriptional regulator PadR